MAHKKRVIGVLGLGLFGSAIVKRLAKRGIEVIGCDRLEKHVSELEDCLTIGSVGDFTDIDFLKEVGLANCDIVVIGTGGDLGSSVLGVINCQELGIKRIICKAKNQRYRQALLALGVSRVVLSEVESGYHVADVISRQSIEDLINLDDETAVVEFRAPEVWIGQGLNELSLRKKYDLNIIGIRKHSKDPLYTQFGADYEFEKDDIVVAVANNEKFDKIDYLERL
ncbi:potassium channel family protein [Aerococcus christensenii]|uniref:potassium channel family protein n=1 Tax=Aerococcus christensenii TaxID=87541 RepID=UPI0023AA0B1C|nr:TrkA family potassium uptake protein [Aerococcus christensenii]WEB70826.1 TrkA family potassium uptake protein [Aerococcus christensenii]